jgi:hypothetical protein
MHITYLLIKCICIFVMQCTAKSCVKEGKALQERTVRCTAERDASYVDDALCDVNVRPPVTQFCDHPQCHAIWNTSEWSAVSKV